MNNKHNASLQQSLKDDFCNFVYMLWDAIPTHGEPGWVQYEVADLIQYGEDRMQIHGMRGLGKTYLLIAFTLWVLYRDPTKKILVLCASAEKAEDFVREVRSLITTVPSLQHLVPRQDQTDKVNKFNVGQCYGDPKVCSVSAYGINSNITGDHVDIIIPDDIETKDNCLTKKRRERTLSKLTELEAILNPGGRIIYLGTPHSDESLYLMLEERGYPIVKFPVYYVDPATADHRIAKCYLDRVNSGEREVGAIVYDEYYTEADLEKRKFRFGPTEWRRQFELRTDVDDAMKRPLKLKDLMVLEQILPDEGPNFLVWSSGPEYHLENLEVPSDSSDFFVRPWKISDDFHEYEKRLMFVDPAGRGPDECAWGVGLGLNGFVFIPEIDGTEESMWENTTLKRIAVCAWKWRVNTVKCEPNYGGGSLTVTLRQFIQEYWREQRDSGEWEEWQIPAIPAVEDSEWAKGIKDIRIVRTCEPIVTQHRVVVSQAVAKDLKWGYQYTHIREERNSLDHDDRVEVFSGILAEFITDIDRSPEMSADMKRRQMLLDRIANWGKNDARFANRMIGDTGTGRLWTR